MMILSFKTKLRLAEGISATTEHEKEWQDYMDKMMEEQGIDSLDGLSQEEKSDFFLEVDKGWNSKKEEGPDGPENSTMASVFTRYK